MSNDPKAVVNRLIEDVINAHRPDLAHEVLHPNLQLRRMGMQRSAQYLGSLHNSSRDGLNEKGAPPADPIEGFKAVYGLLLQAFPDLRNNVVGPQIVDGDTVITHVTFSGTHEGEFLGVAPTHRKVEFDEVLYQKVTDGKVTEVWAVGDELGFLQQLGVLASPED
ncbi:MULTISPECIES: ester cyclase [Streptomyces]|uniref:ester cyclase n=1 Tax=Streptomyces lycopersici TaxID=2974589 RepID=UPI0021CE2D11|nr:ester cyclase [Streptomyces sp. NEAU-383]